VTVVGIAQGGLVNGDNEELVANFVSLTGVTFMVGWDAVHSYLEFPRNDIISPFPLDVVVDRDGTIAYLGREYDPDALTVAVEALLQ
jgi:hypothetical protein